MGSIRESSVIGYAREPWLTRSSTDTQNVCLRERFGEKFSVAPTVHIIDVYIVYTTSRVDNNSVVLSDGIFLGLSHIAERQPIAE